MKVPTDPIKPVHLPVRALSNFREGRRMCIVLSVTLGLQAELTDQQNAEPSIISIPPL